MANETDPHAWDEVAQDAGLDVEVLDDRLDDQVAFAEPVVQSM